ncbi:MAG: CRISPR-associated CARF protein Csa3 [Candidatus Njordarchaeales archaeon]
MGKCFIVTFGWNEDVVISLTLRYSVSSDDRFILILPLERTDPKSEKAFNTLKGFFDKHYPQISPERKLVTVKDFYECTMTILDTIMGAVQQSDEILVNVSGGMRILSLATYTATLIAREFIGDRIKFVDLDIEGLERKTPLCFPPLFLPELGDVEESILGFVLNHGQVSVDDLSKELGKSKSTIYRNVGELERRGLVTTTKIERKTYITLTLTGKMYLEIKAKFKHPPRKAHQ